jgi:GTP-binding protein
MRIFAPLNKAHNGQKAENKENSKFMDVNKIRNIAIIAHVDHGKTTLVDKLLHAGHLFQAHENPGELIMDSNELERERGITILAKNVSVRYKDYKINIIDTPGHSDFGGEVERVLNMADGCLLLVDAFEGPMPQTRFVLQKALQLGLKPIVVINKVDKKNCTPDEVHEQVFDLMFSLDATEEQLDFPTYYGSAKQGWMSVDWKQPSPDITPLLDGIIQYIPAPKLEQGTPQMLITSLEYSSYIGRVAIGRMHRGELKAGQAVALVKRDGKTIIKSRIKDLYVFEGFEKQKVDLVSSGEICAIVGLEGFEIGDTVTDPEIPEALKSIAIDEPTMSMLFTINNSPFYGKEGKFVTSRHIKERLDKELEKNLALRVMDTGSADSFMVYGRGVLHLSVLIETMRREGYELQIGQPQVIYREIDGVKCEPVEELTIDLPETDAGKAIETVSVRKGEMTNMEPKGDRMILKFIIPSRGIIGLRNYLLNVTAGEAIVTHRFKEYQPYKGEIPGRINGSLIVMEEGEAIPYSLHNLQDRGKFFIEPGEPVYEGQVIGEHSRGGDLVINVTKTKKLTNIRASGSDEKMRIAPAVKFSLEEALEYIQADEYVEVTPKSIRLRKIYLKENDRKRERNKAVAV